MANTLRQRLSRAKGKVLLEYSLPAEAKLERRKDHKGLLINDPGPQKALTAACDWLLASQRHSTFDDGGSARHYSLASMSWSPSYPETTGYIVPTLLEEAKHQARPELTKSARLMLDWLVSIQFPEGGFQGGMVDQKPYVPVTFNTGQILLGLAAGTREFDDPAYRKSMTLAANWLRDTLDADGCWRKYSTPFANPGEKSYETHVSWGMFEAARCGGSDDGWSAAALKQVQWAMSKQKTNGWMSACCLSSPDAPLTHTLGYCLKGFVEAWLFSKNDIYLDAAIRLATPLQQMLSDQDTLPGRINANWEGTVPWICLTGQVQIAWSWMALYQATGDKKWLSSAKRANRFVRRTMSMDGSSTTRGGVKGSFPVDGDYGKFQYLNWAAKFLIDSCRKEIELTNTETH